MDKERRSRLKRVVGLARRVVEDDVKVQLRRLGIDEDGIKPVEKLPYLSVEDRELRTKIVEAIEKEKAGDISYGEAFNRYVRHVGFTYVNRIAALRAMEVRNLIKETVIRRDAYGGHSRREYELAEQKRISDPYELLKAGLVEAFNEVSAEIKVLFDVNSEYSLVFLGHKALLELIRLLSEEVPEEDWKEDDIIGWIYQYYNEEARAEFKKSKRKPKADDIPVINQFYTPRWIVRVLVDNTLGRLWLEMNGRCPKLGYPIKRTKEQLENPSGDTVDEFCSYLVPLSQEPPPREKKRVREIKVLDPACGSGHFLVYAFDVLFRMYREDESHTPVEEIPRLILENNLFGIDIDLRAVQLAALSLYLKAKSYNPKLRITKMNLVCADARITDGKVRKAFLERFADDPELQRIFAKIFEDLEYTYEIGSLLKVREPFEKLLERRRQEKGIQAALVPRIKGQTVISKSGKIEGQAKLEMKVLESEETTQVIAIPKEVTLEQMLNALKEFEREAMEKRDMGTLLFAIEAEKSVGLLAVLTEKYDLTLMNPAYGSARTRIPAKTKSYIAKHYPDTKNDYYAAFIEQAIDLTRTNGFVGMLTSRTFLFLKSFGLLRQNLLWNTAVPELLLDTGFGVLDGAMVETAATVLRKTAGIPNSTPTGKKECTFCRLVMFDTYEKEEVFTSSLLTYLEKGEHELWYRTSFQDLSQVPGITYSYWASPSLRALFAKYPPLDRDLLGKADEEKIADLKQGLATADNRRFIRYFWEVEYEKLGKSKRWVPYIMGGGHEKFYANIDRVVNWENNGNEIKTWINPLEGRPYSNVWMLRDTEKNFFFREGLTWTKKPAGLAKPFIAMRFIPNGIIFSDKGPGCFIRKGNLMSLLSIGISKLVYFLLSLKSCEHDWTESTIASMPVSILALESSKLSFLAREAHSLLSEWDTGNETSAIFIKPLILQVLHGFNPYEKPSTKHPFAERFVWSDWESLKQMRSLMGNKKMSLKDLVDVIIKREQIMRNRLEELETLINEEVYRLYGINEEDRKIIEQELALRGEEVSLSEEDEEEELVKEEQIEEALGTETKIQDHAARLISFYIKKILESDPDGIVPLHELVSQIRKKLAEDFGNDQVDAKEREIQEILGKSLEDWVATEYFDFHVNLYKRRPIFWHITSSNFATTRTSRGTINIFLHYHKLDRDTIPKILTRYVQPELEATRWKTERLKRELQEARTQNNKSREKELSKQLEAALSTLEELEGFKKALETVHNPRPDKTKLPKNPTWVQQKIAEVRDNGYNPVIDYGVRVNIEPLKQAGLLHKAAQRVK
jgi:hypothetical protein